MRGRSSPQFDSQCNSVMPQVAPYECHDLPNEVIQIELYSLLAVFFQHPTNAANDRARPAPITNDALEHGTCPLHVRRVPAEPT